MRCKTLSVAFILGAISSNVMAQSDPLRFDADDFTVESLTMPDGQEVKFRAYEGIYYVTNIEDSTYQTLNIYVPEHLADIGTRLKPTCDLPARPVGKSQRQKAGRQDRMLQAEAMWLSLYFLCLR